MLLIRYNTKTKRELKFLSIKTCLDKEYSVIFAIEIRTNQVMSIIIDMTFTFEEYFYMRI